MGEIEFALANGGIIPEMTLVNHLEVDPAELTHISGRTSCAVTLTLTFYRILLFKVIFFNNCYLFDFTNSVNSWFHVGWIVL